MIDNRLFSIPGWGSVYVINEEKKALIECRSTTSVRVVLDGIREIGINPEDISYIIVTHIHLDHTGGVGVLARHMPQAQVAVHHKGARHLIDPNRLIAGTVEAQGNEVMATYGEVLPLEVHRV